MADLNARFLGANGADVGLRPTKNIEWVEVVAVNSDTTNEVVYNYKKIKNCVGVLCCGPFQVAITNVSKTVTITPTVLVVEGTYYVGLIEG